MATIPPLPSLPTLPTIPSLMPEIPTFPQINSPKIADSIFTSGLDSKVVVGDVYNLTTGAKGTSPITSIQELNLEAETSFFGKLDGSSPAEFVAKLKEGLEFDVDKLSARALGTSSAVKGSWSDLTDATKRQAMVATFKDKTKYVTTTIGQTKSLVNTAKSGDVRALGNFVNKYTNSPVFSNSDKGALGGVLSSVVSTSSKLGISGVFTTLTSTLNDNSVIGKMTRTLLPTVVANSDSKLLKEMTTGDSAKLINVFSPGFTQNFSKAFSYRGTNTKSLTSFEDIVGSFGNIDKKWDSIERGKEGNTATNLWSLVKGSQDFQNLLITGVSYWAAKEKAGVTPPVGINKMFALATVFSEVSVGRAIARDFPKVSLLSAYNTKLPTKNGLANGTRSASKKAVDPRLLKSGLANFFS